MVQSELKKEGIHGGRPGANPATHLANKLMEKWQGPYYIQAKVTLVTYEIDMSDKKKRQHIFHVKMLSYGILVQLCV